MTRQPPDPPMLDLPDDDPLDLAASAVVDGVATDEERALADTDDGRARVEALRRLHEVLHQAPPAMDEGRRETALAAALDQAVAPPMSLAAARARRRPTTLALLGVAAAVVVVLGAGAVVVRSHTDRGHLTADTVRLGSETTSSAAEVAGPASAAAPAPATTAAADGASTGAGAASSATPGPTPTPRGPASATPSTAPPALIIPSTTPATRPASAPAAPGPTYTAGPTTTQRAVVDGGDLGRQDDVDALAQRVAAAIEGSQDEGTTTTVDGGTAAVSSDVAACEAQARQAAAPTALGAERYRAVATYQGTPAVVLGYDAAGDDGGPPRVVLVLDRRACSKLASARA